MAKKVVKKPAKKPEKMTLVERLTDYRKRKEAGKVR